MMDVKVVVIPGLSDSGMAVRCVIDLGERDHLLMLSPQQIGREVTEVMMRAEQVIAEAIDTLRSNAHERRPASTLPSMTSTPSCTGCGSIVEKKGDLCVSCAMKRTGLGPEASIALVNQGEPLYKREGNFRDTPSEREETPT